MIAKRVDRVGNNKGFSALARYVAGAKEKGEKLDKLWFVNCDLAETKDDLEVGIVEVTAAQSANARSKTDPNYHLVISFRDERPDAETLKEIEKSFASKLGFEKHQRVAATHHNTENFHMHVVYSKICPETGRCVTPHRDFKKLQEACREMERRYGLKVDNGPDKDPQKGRLSVKERDYEYHTWELSFRGYLAMNRQPLLDIREESETWEQFHKGVARYGLVVRKSANGLAFEDPETKRRLGAGKVDRKFTLKRMEEKLGPFQSPVKDPLQEVRQKERYRRLPLSKKCEETALWKKYTRQKKVPSWKKFVAMHEMLDAEAKRILKEQDALMRGLAGAFNHQETTRQQQTQQQSQERDRGGL